MRIARSPLLLVGLVLGALACARGESSPLTDRRPESPSDAASVAPDPFAVLVDPSSERLRQVGKSPEDLERFEELVPISEFPQSLLPDAHVRALGVRVIETREVEQLLDGGWAVVDVRAPADHASLGVVPGSLRYTYVHAGRRPDAPAVLDREVCETLLEEHEGIVFLSNGPKCPRSFNASVAAVRDWGVPGSAIRWYRGGAPAWSRSPLVPPEHARRP